MLKAGFSGSPSVATMKLQSRILSRTFGATGSVHSRTCGGSKDDVLIFDVVLKMVQAPIRPLILPLLLFQEKLFHRQVSDGSNNSVRVAVALDAIPFSTTTSACHNITTFPLQMRHFGPTPS